MAHESSERSEVLFLEGPTHPAIGGSTTARIIPIESGLQEREFLDRMAASRMAWSVHHNAGADPALDAAVERAARANSRVELSPARPERFEKARQGLAVVLTVTMTTTAFSVGWYWTSGTDTLLMAATAAIGINTFFAWLGNWWIDTLNRSGEKVSSLVGSKNERVSQMAELVGQMAVGLIPTIITFLGFEAIIQIGKGTLLETVGNLSGWGELFGSSILKSVLSVLTISSLDAIVAKWKQRSRFSDTGILSLYRSRMVATGILGAFLMNAPALSAPGAVYAAIAAGALYTLIFGHEEKVAELVRTVGTKVRLTSTPRIRGGRCVKAIEAVSY